MAIIVGCGEQGGTNAPPVGSGGNPNPNTTTAGGSSGAGSTSGTSDDSGTTSGTCTVDCPEGEGGVCPGHAEWTRGIIVFGLWESNNSGNRAVAPSAGDDDEPVCARNIGLCVEYDDPEDVEISASNLLADQLAACNALSLSEINDLGLDDISVGAGWDLIHHWCVPENGLTRSYQGESYTLNGDVSIESCTSAAWSYEGFCSAEDCPIGGGETGGSDSTGVVDSSGDTSAGAYDCSDVDGSNVSYTTTTRGRTLIERDATIRRPLAELLVTDPYTAMFVCDDASISPTTNEIWHIGHSSILRDLGLVEDDVIVSVDGETKHVQMYDAIADEMINGGSFEVIVERGETTLEYDVTIAPPT